MFIDQLLRHAGQRPTAAALVRGGQTVTYAELAERVEADAASLRRQGIAPGDVAGLTIGDEIAHLVACLALMRLGVVQITLGTQDPPVLRDRLCARVGVTCHVTAGPTVERAAPAGAPPQLLPNERPAIILPGSGTTGDVKLVSLSLDQIAIQAAIAYADYGDARILQLAPVEFNNGKRLRLYCLHHGGACVFRDAQDPPLAVLCGEQGVTWFDLSAYHARDLIAASATHGGLPDGTSVRIGGSRVSTGLRGDFRERVTPRLFISYGATEIGGMPGICMAAPEQQTPDAELVGRPLAGMEVEIVDEAGRPVPPGTVGEVRIRAPGMVTHYIGDAEATRRCFRDGGWFQPGDLMSLSADRMLTFHGRVDDMIILNSINIFPGEIERALEGHPLVAEAAAYPVASGVHGQIPVAAVELRPGAAIEARALMIYARERLGLRAPRRITIVPELPRSGQGKVLKRVLAGPA
ncbi:acetyl-CoA synthetase [Allostella sp. ATCC 35155]|nr:acetyl-CoA synthetase [Stella sp. ATCC 35155]